MNDLMLKGKYDTVMETIKKNMNKEMLADEIVKAINNNVPKNKRLRKKSIIHTIWILSKQERFKCDKKRMFYKFSEVENATEQD